MHRIATHAAIASVLLTGCLNIDDTDGDLDDIEIAEARYAASGLQGHSLQGHSLQGHSLQGHSLQGLSFHSMSRTGFRSAEVESLDLIGTELMGLLHDGSAAWAEDMVGVEFDLVLSSGEPGTLTLTSFELDTSRTTMFEAENQSNDDVFLYTAVIDHPGAPAPYNACGEGGQGFFLEGSWDGKGYWREEGITFTCTSGVLSKCVRGWGYKPWQSMVSEGVEFPADVMRDFHSACVRAAMADYCANGTSHTLNGTWIDMIDTANFNRRHPEDAMMGMFAYESVFIFDGPWEISRTRHEHLDPREGQGCTLAEEIHEIEFSWQDLEAEPVWNDATLSLDAEENRRVLVSSSTLCSHSPGAVGKGLAPDCNECTAAVCDDATGDPTCCSGWWSQSCVDRAAATCGALVNSQPLPAVE